MTVRRCEIKVNSKSLKFVKFGQTLKIGQNALTLSFFAINIDEDEGHISR